MITQEQSDQVKQQLLKQLENFPEDKREKIKKQILTMSQEDIEIFIKQNQLSHLSPESETQCIFCSIIQGQTPAYIFDQNKDSIAILELNPLSKGHSLILPKQHLEIEEIPSSAFSLAKKIAKKLKAKFKPQEVQISPTKIINHSLIEVIPIYGNEKERKKATEQELKDLQETLITKPKKAKQKSKKTESAEKKLPVITPKIP